MGGRAARQKGSRVELLVRDKLREQGFEADRVPLSGAAQGFKGDVRYKLGSVEGSVEVKARRSEFNSIYQLYTKITSSELPYSQAFGLYIDGKYVAIGTSPAGILDNQYAYTPLPSSTRGVKKLLSLEKLLGTSDMLAIKGDNKPILFLRFS